MDEWNPVHTSVREALTVGDWGQYALGPQELLKSDCRPGSPWMRWFIAECYEILARRPSDSADEG